jgi:hypothetical protein
VSTFLGGVVRRGAGLPSPVTIRPSTAPHDLPPVVPAHAAPEGQDEFTDTPLMSPASIREPLPGSPLKNQAEPAPRPDTPTRITSRTDVPFDRVAGMQPPPAPIDPIAAAKTAGRAQSEHRDPVVHASKTVLAAPRADGVPPPLPASRQRLEPRVESGAAGQPPPPTSSPARAHAETEPRHIQVKIGRVEIRSTPPPAPASRPARRNPRSGFDDVSLVRRYLDRSGR